MDSPLLVIAGPTASGKTALSIALAKRLNGEILSCDSMQIYRECDIVTAKPTPDEQSEAPHHLLDICNPDEQFSAASWARKANETISQIEGRGHIPIVCGGTGFYLRALIQPETLAVAPPDMALRASLQNDLLASSNEAMHARLAELAPDAATRLHANDTHRVLRALEVALAPTKGESSNLEFAGRRALVFCLDWPREMLYERIERRIDMMIEEGARAELETLIAKWGADAPALGGVGYKQMRPTLEDATLWDECIETWKRDTRRFAKRQLTWFRGQTEAIWLDGREDANTLAERIKTEWQNASNT